MHLGLKIIQRIIIPLFPFDPPEMEDHRPRWGGWTSNPDGAASGPWQVRLL